MEPNMISAWTPRQYRILAKVMRLLANKHKDEPFLASNYIRRAFLYDECAEKLEVEEARKENVGNS